MMNRKRLSTNIDFIAFIANSDAFQAGLSEAQLDNGEHYNEARAAILTDCEEWLAQEYEIFLSVGV